MYMCKLDRLIHNRQCAAFASHGLVRVFVGVSGQKLILCVTIPPFNIIRVVSNVIDSLKILLTIQPNVLILWPIVISKCKWIRIGTFSK